MADLAIESYSGSGTMSEPWLEGGYDVHRFDNDPYWLKVPNTKVRDLVAEPLSPAEFGVVDSLSTSAARTKVAFMHFAPVCTQFSHGFASPRSVARREGRDYQPCLDQALACAEAITTFKPRWWCVENVRGAIPYFDPIFGPYSKIYGHPQNGPWFLWTNIPNLPDLPDQKWSFKGSTRGSRLRSITPRVIADCVFQSAHAQTKLSDFA